MLFRAAIMGPPGSGKGTISKRIAQSFGLQYLSSGHYLRESIAANTGRIHLFGCLSSDSKKKVLQKAFLIFRSAGSSKFPVLA
uniref:Uncharacterized protein n=1 Tax=Acanthochromis polyacanthus TaxID=80966 RepID=A0A3Q1ECZ8_9TELE